MTETRRRWLVGLLLTGHLLLTAAYSLATPLGEAPDEADHWAFVVYLAEERRLPVGPWMTQGKHPPLYHATAAAVASMAGATNDFLRPNPDVQLVPEPGWTPNFFLHSTQEDMPWQGGVLAFRLARFWSALLSTATLWAAYRMVRRGFPGWDWLSVTAVGMLAFLPEFAFIGGTVNNDNGAAFFGTLALWGGLALWRGGGRFRPGWWTPLALGLGFLTKVSTVALWPAVGVAIVWGAVADVPASPGRGLAATLQAVAARWRRWLGTGFLVFGPAVAMAAPWLMRNRQLYGDLLGLEMARQTVDLRLTPWTAADTLWLLRGWFISSWGKFGGAGHIPMHNWVYGLLLAVSAMSVAGLGRLWLDPERRTERQGLVLLGLSVIGVMAVMWRYSLMALGTDQGRLLYPAVAALVSLFAAGLLAWASLRRQGLAGGIIIVASLFLGLYGLIGVVRPAFAPPTPLPDEVAAEMASDKGIDFGELSLVAWSLEEGPILYWRADENPSRDWRVILRVLGEDDALVWEWRRSPGAGRLSTDHWSAGSTWPDRYHIVWPSWAVLGLYAAEVGLQPHDGEPVIPMDGSSATVPLGWLERR